MPFSSTPVYVGRGDQVQVRYPTPSTWNTKVTVNVRIGTGNDPDGIVFGTRVPDSRPDQFNFTDQQASTSATASTAGQFTSIIEKATTYYSNEITVSGIDIPIPASISVTTAGPKGNTTGQNASAAFRITRNGTTGPWITSSTDIRNGDVIRLRVTTENWYTTNTNVTLTLSDETWGTNLGLSSTVVSDTWSITTRAQDQNITAYSFTDYVDVPKPSDPGGASYKTQNISIAGIDSDVVLRASATGDGQVSKDNVNWSQSVTGLKLNDTLYTRIAVGTNNTQKTTANFNVFAVAGDTLAGGYENNSAGTYGSGTFAVSQSLGTVTDTWQVWTEVDRYPNSFSLSPIFTRSDSLATVTAISTGSGYTNDQVYSVTGGSGTGMTVKVSAFTSGASTGSVTGATIVEKGSGYQIGNVVTITGGNNNAQLRIDEYENVVVSSTTTNNACEVGRTYYADFTVSGLGTEYASNAYSDLEAPTNISTSILPISTSVVNGSNVQILCAVTQGGAEIRKNNTGNWVQQIYVQNGDVVNTRLTSSTSFNTTLTSRVELLGPPNGGPNGNPTLGPSTPTYANKFSDITLKTRLARSSPYPFRVENVYDAQQGTQIVKQIPIAGLDVNATAQIISQTPGSSAQLSLNGVTYASSITVTPTQNVIYIRASAPTSQNSVNTITYKIGDVSDTFSIYTRRIGWDYGNYSGSGSTNFIQYDLPEHAETFDLTVVGAGGGNGGDDLPNSFGGRGGFGNLLRASITLPDNIFPINPLTGFPDRRLKIFAPDGGENGITFTTGGTGGTGGWGYAVGGNGGNAGPSDKSGSGGGGGGAAAVTLWDGTPIIIAGGGGGGAGAGNDTTPPTSSQNGNNAGPGLLRTSTAGLSLSGNAGANNTAQGGGAGGGGGGFGAGGSLSSTKVDESGITIQTTDLDANGGAGGGGYYNSSYVTLYNTLENYGAGPGEPGRVVIGIPPQDITPDPFFFADVDNAVPGQEVESERVAITGVNGRIVFVAAAEFDSFIRVCDQSAEDDPTGASCTMYTATSQFVKNGQYVQIKATPGDQFFTSYLVRITVGDTETYWSINTGPPPDREPNAFTIPDKSDQPRNTLIESDVITITGINTPVTVIASNGAQVSVNNGSFVNTPTNVSNNDTLKVRLLSSPDFNTEVNTSIIIGESAPYIWTVRTEIEKDTTPNSFAFTSLFDQDLNVEVRSNPVTIRGIETTVPFSVTTSSGTNATIIKNDVDLGVSSTTVELFDVVRLKYTTTDVVGETKVFTVSVGETAGSQTAYSTTWTVNNLGQLGTRPDAFTFTTQVATGPGVDTNSNIVTISGLQTAVSVFATNNALLSINGGAFTRYTVTSPGTINNGQTLQVRLKSFEIEGFSVQTTVFVGAYNTDYIVQTPADPGSPVLGQWYSSIQPVKISGSNQIRFSSKYDGIPIGSMMPVFQDATEDDFWGNLNGKFDSRFHGWIYCDGSYLDVADYKPLYDTIGETYGLLTTTESGTATAGSNQITVSSASSLKVGYRIFTQGGSVTVPARTFIKAINGNTITLSNQLATGGAFTFRVVYEFRLPDLRNRKVLGTGNVDGRAASSPIVAPRYGPTKTSGTGSGFIPGSFGGMWFIDTIGDPGIDELEQVETPGAGLPAQESQFFAIAQISTTGYENVTGQIEFTTTGKISGNVGLKDNPGTRIFEVPFHTHLLITGQADPGGGKGRVSWDGAGGYNARKIVGNGNQVGSIGPSQESDSVQINLWGYAVADYTITSNNDTVQSAVNHSQGPLWYSGTSFWSCGVSPGYEGLESISDFGSLTIRQQNIPIGGANYNEINNYVDLNAMFGGAATSGSEDVKFVGAITIPRRQISVQSFNPATRNSHTHYLSLVSIPTGAFSYGNSDGGGTGYTQGSITTPTNTTVNVEFTAEELGLEVLPGTFVLSNNKQLIPTPSLSPQEQVPLITPYMWIKWLIKAF